MKECYTLSHVALSAKLRVVHGGLGVTGGWTYCEDVHSDALGPAFLGAPQEGCQLIIATVDSTI